MIRSQSSIKHESRVGLTINRGQHENKKNYYYSFKTYIAARPGLQVKLAIDPNQYKNKNKNNYNFKTQLNGQLEVKLVS